MPETRPIEIDSAVTTIILQRPRKDCVEAYEAWLKEIVPLAQRFPGHRGVSVIRPNVAGADYTVALHFDSEANLRNWLESDTRRHMIEKAKPLLASEEKIEIKTGLEFWFTPSASGKAAPPYKQFLITLSAIFPLSIAVPWALQPLFAWLPFLALPGLRQLIVVAAIVALMTFLVMPRYVRAVSKWLYR
jgi:antibiotic biosynthesis monooxygenase (ABM) superfamily enzyme